jgi:hypothetical protein
LDLVHDLTENGPGVIRIDSEQEHTRTLAH